MTMTYDLQSVASPTATLVGICQIRRYETEDDIYLGDTLLGEILEIDDTNVPFEKNAKLYTFKSIMGNVYPRRSSYLECWFDILIEIANDSDLAIEFAILSQAKASKNNETVTLPVELLDKSEETF